MGKLRIIFLGNNPKYFLTLLKLTNLVAVFTKHSDTDINVKKILAICKEKNIPVYRQHTIKLDIDRTPYDIIKKINPDLIVSGGYHLVVPEEIINIPKYKTINIHQALLPRYRGQHVIQWQIINDEKETGTTIHYMSKKLDEGNIIKQKKCLIKDEDNALTIWEKTSGIGSLLLKEVIHHLEKYGSLKSIKQDETAATYYRARKLEDGRINWKSTCRQIFNLVRALVSPWP